MTTNFLGFQKLADRYAIRLIQPLLTQSRLGTERRSLMEADVEHRFWPASYMPQDDLRGHFEFGLKYERMNFEFFSRLFAVIEPQEVQAWVRDAPTGQYARRCGFFYEWFTGLTLDVPDTPQNVPYVDALPSRDYLCASKSHNSKRWKVRDNMPGDARYCPLVYLGPVADRGWIYDVAAGVEKLDNTYGKDLLMRSAAWLTFKESRASFAIEHEDDNKDRVRRFAAAIQEHSGKMAKPLFMQNLQLLQRSILGENALRLGVRSSPVFVGQTGFKEVVHYIAPMGPDVLPMLEGLLLFDEKIKGCNPVVRAAAVSFAFVYLHPLSDGNGRVHRFLINHLLAEDGATPAHIIIPVSATIAGSARGLAEYDKALEGFSRPLMRRYADEYRFGEEQTYPDGVSSNLEFPAAADALHAWRYIDLTEKVHYLSGLLRETVEHEMADEAEALRTNDAARAAIKEVVEMPDADADRIIRSLKASQWTVSGKLAREWPMLFAQGGRLFHLHAEVVSAVRDAFVRQPGAKA